MAKLFDTADAERLIQEHRMMLEELDEIAQYEDNVQIDIEKAANLVVTRNVLDVLRDIPVEEINREKGGFRVKAFRVFYSEHTLADFEKKYPILREKALVRRKWLPSPF